jgi:hypothetical protein
MSAICCDRTMRSIKMQAKQKGHESTIIDIVLGFISLVSLYIGIKSMLSN